jgi:penicillin-binding protein 1A
MVLALLAGGALLVSTPSVSDAEQRAATLDSEHNVALLTTPVPTRFASALIATENSRFYSTPGIDPISIARAAINILTGHSQDVGGATLDQQLAKELYDNGQANSMRAKAQQATLGVKLDTTYSKQQILAMYASVVYFGHGYWGLDAASHGYFGVQPDQLTWGQAAMLAGVVQAPSAYDPIAEPDLARARQQHVLNRLVATGALTPGEAATVAAEPLHLVNR